MSATTVKPDGDFTELVTVWNQIESGYRANGKWSAEDHARGLDWLGRALHTAIQLEFSTIPPYLCALWSIEDQQAAAALSIRRIVQQEMLHMALACNMLVSLGGTPKLNSPDFAPQYPSQLPGGVHKGLVVGLSGLSKDTLEAFMTIELPEIPPENETNEVKAYFHVGDVYEGHRTIGQFYDCLRGAFHALEPELSTDRQIAGPLAWIVVRNLADVDRAIDLIEHQGEGSSLGPEDSGRDDLAHFYRFAEIHKGRRIVFDEKAKDWKFGEALDWPSVFPMSTVPEGGYPDRELSDEVASLLESFDRNYSKLLDELTKTWADGDQGKLIAAIDTMFDLQGDARALMQVPRPGGDGNFGPQFRFQG